MRAAQSQAANAASAAGTQAGQYESSAQAQQANLMPFLTKRLNAEHAYSPDQLNELLTAAGAGAGGATAGLTGQAELEAARTGNSAASTAALDAMARSRQQAGASQSEGVAAQDVEGARQNQQAAAGQLGSLYGVNTDAALKAMGIQNQDINTEIEAGKSGWLQNMTGMISALGNAASGAGALGFKI